MHLAESSLPDPVRVRPRRAVSPTGDVTTLGSVERARRAAFPVALVNMPFVSILRPSVQIGLLASIARSHGFPTDTFHYNLELAQRVGATLYEALASCRGDVALGDWLFTRAAFGDESPALDLEFPAAHAEALRSRLRVIDRDDVEVFTQLRDEVVPAFLDDLVEGTDWGRYAVVGFTSTFEQNNASFALARAIKQRHPGVVTVFGGANFEGTMASEWVRTVPTVDYAVAGEGDRAFPELLIELSEGRAPRQVPGIVFRSDDGVVAVPGEAPFERMDELPIPSYGEYFERAERLGLLSGGARRMVQVPFESARGCWWGAKRHCTFCGLNGQNMTFRSKSPGRVLHELGVLSRAHRTFQFQAVDNIIDTTYFDTVMPAIIASGSTYELFYEVKADLTFAQLDQLKRGGVKRVQPGIESLSSHVLMLMRKGTRSSTNVNLLRMGRMLGVDIAWNLIWGFPGERPEDYDEQAALVPLLVHLQPPAGHGPIWMERFSPLFRAAAEEPERNRLRPDPSLRYVYPDHVDLEKAAYFFRAELEGTLPPETYDATAKALDAWRQLYGKEATTVPSLRYFASPGFLVIEDRRAEHEVSYVFDDPLATLYLLCCDRPRSARMLVEEFRLPFSASEVEAKLDEFVEAGLMLRDGNLFLALALPATFSR